MSQIIGKVSATEKSPSTCDDFSFWLTDETILSPFDIVRVTNPIDRSDTYGVVQDILHITDSPSHISNYISSDFGDAEAESMTRKLAFLMQSAPSYITQKRITCHCLMAQQSILLMRKIL
jgi:hypothetical protein